MPADQCYYCDKGFPIEKGWHYGTQRLGMIHGQRCKLLPPDKEGAMSYDHEKATKAVYQVIESLVPGATVKEERVDAGMRGFDLVRHVYLPGLTLKEVKALAAFLLERR